MPENKEFLTFESKEILKPIKEDEKYAYFQGIALTPTNIERYYGILNIPEEELIKATPTLQGKPFLKEHKASIDAVIGKVEQATYENGIKVIVKILKAGNEALIEKIKEGLVKKLSAGFKRTLEFNQDKGVYIAKNIEFFELSLVLEGADKNATLFEKNQTKKEEFKMPENITIEQLSKEKAQLEEQLGKLKADFENLQKENEVLKAEIDRLKELSKLGQEYIENLRADVKKWITVVEGEKAEGLLKIVETADLDQLKAFKEVYEPKAKTLLQNKAQETQDTEQFNSPEQGEKLNKSINEMTLEELKTLEEKFMKEVN